jgi:hypothetical protein
MKKNELRFSKTLNGDILVSLWSINTDTHYNYLIGGAHGDTKMKAVWALIKWLYRYGNLNELFYIKSVKHERRN